MAAQAGKFYYLKHERSLWSYGPESRPGCDDVALYDVHRGARLFFVKEFRDPHSELKWVKVIFMDAIGYLECGMLSVGSLLSPSPIPGHPPNREEEDQMPVELQMSCLARTG